MSPYPVRITDIKRSILLSDLALSEDSWPFTPQITDINDLQMEKSKQNSNDEDKKNQLNKNNCDKTTTNDSTSSICTNYESKDNKHTMKECMDKVLLTKSRKDTRKIKPYETKCDICAKYFRKDRIQKHQEYCRKVQAKPYACPHCQIKFSRSNALAKHMKSTCPYTNDRQDHKTSSGRKLNSEETFSCICGSKFKSNCILLNHIKVFKNMCPFCFCSSYDTYNFMPKSCNHQLNNNP